MKTIYFNEFYKSFNILSGILIIVSLVFLIFKGLNFGVDFKGGTLIELRTDKSTANITKIRDSFNQMNLGDVSVKNFGNETDFVVKFEKQNSNDPKFITIRYKLQPINPRAFCLASWPIGCVKNVFIKLPSLSSL